MELKKLNNLVEKLSVVKEVKLIALYGSFARGDYGRKSDIDLFILLGRNGKIKEKVEDIIIKNTADFERRIAPVIRIERELKETDEGFLDNIFREGKILYSKNMEADVKNILKLKPYLIFMFNLKKLKLGQKRKFNFALYGTKMKKYKYVGLLERAGGKKLSSGCVFVPESGKIMIEELFKTYKIEHDHIRVWGF